MNGIINAQRTNSLISFGWIVAPTGKNSVHREMYRFVVTYFPKQPNTNLCQIALLVFVFKQIALQVSRVIGGHSIHKPRMGRGNKIALFTSLSHFFNQFLHRLCILIKTNGIFIEFNCIFPGQRLIVGQECIVLNNIIFCFFVISSDNGFIGALKKIAFTIGCQFHAFVGKLSVQIVKPVGRKCDGCRNIIFHLNFPAGNKIRAQFVQKPLSFRTEPDAHIACHDFVVPVAQRVPVSSVHNFHVQVMLPWSFVHVAAVHPFNIKCEYFNVCRDTL